MYKELYLGLCKLFASNATSYEATIDMQGLRVRLYSIYQLAIGEHISSTITFTNTNTIDPNACRGSFIKNIVLPDVTACGAYSFYGCPNLKSITADNCETFGTSSLVGCTSLENVYVRNLAKASTQGFPWGCNNPDTVFHFADGNFDYQGNPVV